MEFAPLKAEQVIHRFSLRRNDTSSATPEEIYQKLGLPPDTRLTKAEQVHGNLVAQVTAKDQDRIISQVDALITNQTKITLCIRTADCGPVFFYDPVHQAIGLAHSGKKGTALNICGEVIAAMNRHYTSQAADLIVVLGPCIRPPQYDIDFAAEIGRQIQAAGVRRYLDCGLNTGADLEQFYSYRMEKGQTERHYAFLSLRH